jgi:PAS domain-containing protein
MIVGASHGSSTRSKEFFFRTMHAPMALAIRERRAVRGVEALAERPDGSRIRFVPYPTPLLDKSGEMVGAINLLVDVTEQRHVEALRSQAERCRRLAKGIDDARIVDTLTGMAADYEAQAAAILTAN